METRSLRFKLALTYAGMALLTVAILGGILLAVLGSYYARAEDAYLRAAAQRIVAEPVPVGPAAGRLDAAGRSLNPDARACVRR